MWDCVIVGGGPAGLTAATYLGRFRRRVLLVDAGESRLKRIPLTRNAPGFPDGIAGRDLHARLQSQASRYGAVFCAGRVNAARKASDGFSLSVGDDLISARTVLLATGARLTEPSVEDLDRGVEQGLIRYCPICDGYEVRDRSIAVLGGRPDAIAEAHFLRTYSERVAYYWIAELAPTLEERDCARANGITVAPKPTLRIRLLENVVELIGDAGAATADVLYPCLGCEPASELARELRAGLSAQGGVQTNAHQQTSVAGCYAAGDVLQGVDQIASACGQAAIAAVAIHNALG
jgi:thioredoxin reductase (NADPH)